MKKTSLLRLGLAGVLVIVVAVGSVGCMPGGKELAMAFVEEWMNDNDVNPKTFTGAANIFKRTTSGSTGDPKADAALETVSMLMNFVQAENLMDKGRKNDDAAAMTEAIKLRPNDWSYQLSRSTLALKQGQEGAGTAWYSEAYNRMLSDKNSTAASRFYSQAISEYEPVVKGPKFPSLTSETQAKMYYDLREAYRGRYDVTKDINDGKMADFYNAKYQEMTGKK